MRDIIKKADVLIEALPYIRRFKGEIVVIKAGGSMLEDKPLIGGIFEDIIFLSAVGVRPVLIHGGGPRINAGMKKKGLHPKFVDGFRVTDAATIKIVYETLNEAGRDIVRHIEELNGRAKALSSKKDRIILAAKLKPKGRDLGFVGRILSVNTRPIRKVLDSGAIPVISPSGRAADGRIYNINGDQAACEIAAALKAEKFVLITDTKGILMDEADENTLISTINKEQADRLIEKGVIRSGMIPKVQAAIGALNKGVNKTHIIDGRLSHAILLEIFTDKGIGTEIVK